MLRMWMITISTLTFAADTTAYRKECLEQNNLGSCEQLHDYLLKNQEDESTLIAISEVLCHGGRIQSCTSLAAWHAKRNQPLLQIKWLKKACQNPQDQGASCFAIAEIADRENHSKDATHWRRRACSKGHKAACPTKP